MNDSKRVLIIRSNPVDPDPRVEKEANTLLGDGFDVDIFCWDRSGTYKLTKTLKKLDNGWCSVYRTGIKASFGGGFKANIGPLMKFQIAICRFLFCNSRKYDYIHACDFDTALAAFLASRGRKVKFIYDIFDYYADAFSVPHSFRKIVVALDKRIINHADAVIICSEQRESQIRNTDPNKLVVLHNSPEKVDLEDKIPENDKLRVAYVGILSEGRLIPEMLEVIGKDPDRFELHIAGFGILEPLVKKYAKECDNILFYGKTDYSQTLQIENNADIMTAIYDPSVANHKYAAPNKFYEALMLGKPLLMCRGTGMSDVLESTNIGVCIDYSLEGLKKGLQFIADNYSHFRSMSSEEKSLFDQNYSWDIMKARLVDLYNTL